MKTRYAPLAIAMASLAASSVAMADDQTIVLTRNGAGAYTANFNDMHSVSGLFVDTFTFVLPSLAIDSPGSGMLSFSSLTGPVSLVVATLRDALGAEVDSPADAASIAVPSFLTFSSFTAPLTLTVLATAGDPFSDPIDIASSYGGSITFDAPVAAVPEPGTYALLLAGLGAVGLARKRGRADVKATLPG